MNEIFARRSIRKFLPTMVEDEKIESSEDNLLDGMKNILNRVELCSRLIDIDPVRCRLELGSVMKILTDLIEEKDESDF